jgi:hypothetical protein
MKYLRLLGVLLVGAALAACQTTQSLPGQGKSGGVVPEDLTERYVHQIVGSLGDSFVARDSQGFMKYVSDGFYKGHDRLLQALELEFSTGRAPYLEAVVADVSEEDTRVTAVVTWSRSPGSGADADFSGETLLVLHKGESLSLVDFRGGSLFGIGGF